MNIQLQKMMRNALILSSVVLATHASAGVLYNGAEFSVNLVSQVGTTYRFEYVADFTNWNTATAGNQLYIAAVNFKPDTGAVPVISLISTNAPGTWSVENGNANNNGCGGGADSFVCSEVDPLASAATSGTPIPIYNWVFQLQYTSLLGAGAFTDAPIRAWFVDATGSGTGLMSLNTDICIDDECGGGPPTAIPEPGSLALLGGALFGLWAVRRRKEV